MGTAREPAKMFTIEQMGEAVRAEREACALIADAVEEETRCHHAVRIAAAIRARGNGGK